MINDRARPRRLAHTKESKEYSEWIKKMYWEGEQMILVRIIVTMASLVISTAAYSSESGSTIVEQYVGSPNLPDWIAYRTFLTMAQGHGSGTNHIDGYIAKVLGIADVTDETTVKVKSYRVMFQSDSLEIERQIERELQRIFCPDDWNSMSFEEIIQGLYKDRDFREQIYKRYYEATLEVLSKSERSAFKAYLERAKKSISHTQHDSRRYYENRPDDLRIFHLSVCNPDSLAKKEVEGSW